MRSVVGLICLLFVSNVFADQYVGVSVGTNFWPRSSNSEQLESGLSGGYHGTLTVGHQLNDKWSVEGAFAYRRNDVHGINPRGDIGPNLSADGNRIHGYSLHANVLRTVGEFGRVKPYLLAGIGTTYVRINYEFDDSGREINDSSSGISGQVGIGSRIDVSERFSIDVAYRYMRATSLGVIWDNGTSHHQLDINYDNHSIVCGLIVRI